MRLLFLTHRVPYAPNRGDRIRAYQMLRYFKARGICVCLVALAHDDDEMASAGQIAGLVDALHVVRVTRATNLVKAGLQLLTDRPLTHVLLDSPKMRPVLEQVRRRWKPDVALAFCSGMARFAMEPPLDTLPFVLDMVDVDSFKWEALGREGRGPRSWIYRREARVLRRFEAAATRAARGDAGREQARGRGVREVSTRRLNPWSCRLASTSRSFETSVSQPRAPRSCSPACSVTNPTRPAPCG